MATLEAHGGECCGIRHIYGMDNTTITDLDRLIANLRQRDRGATSGRLIEIVLSSRQVGDTIRGNTNNGWAPCVREAGGWPAVMAARGFRLVSRFLNANSGRECFIFHWVPHFQSIMPNDLPFTWDHGDYAPPATGGDRTFRPAAPAQGEWNVGDRIRYTLEGCLFNRIATITRIRDEIGDGRCYDLRFDDETTRERYTSTYFQRVEAAAPAAPVPARVLYTSYHNVLRTGRGAGHATLAAARAAAPRARQVDKLEVMSDGQLRWAENVRV